MGKNKNIYLIKISILFFLFSCFSCSSSKTQSTTPTTPTESTPESREIFQIKEARKLYQQKDYAGVDRILEMVNDTLLTEDDRIDKYNLWGLALYAQSDFASSLSKFQKAKSFVVRDRTLNAQISLNMATCQYKMLQTRQAWESLKSVEYESLPAVDVMKFHTLSHWLAETLQLTVENLFSLIQLCHDANEERDLLKKDCGIKIQTILENSDSETQVGLLDKLPTPTNFAAFYWGQRIQIKLKRKSLMAQADKVGHWLNAYTANTNYSPTDRSKYQGMQFEVDDEIVAGKIGVVLPATGDRAEIGRKILGGLRDALKYSKTPVELVIKDGANAKNIEKIYVELATKDRVGLVIGGAFPSTTEQEYQLATHLKMIFISLASVNLGEESKTFDLFEISGSAQSQAAALFTESTASKLGRNFVLIYPGDASGAHLSDTVWKHSNENKFVMENVSTYSRGMTDYRETVLELLGLKYSRERLEEYNLWYRLYYYKTKNDLSRIQVLKPKVDFNWIYLPSTPSEAMQIISSFIYAEAKNLTFIGGPQWRSAQLMRTSMQWTSKILFLDSMRNGNWIKDNGENILDGVGSIPEYLGLEAMITALAIYKEMGSSMSRNSWSNKLEELDEIEEAVSIWHKKGTNWVKDMQLFSIEKDGKVIAL